MPWRPVQALALPELMTTAWVRPLAVRGMQTLTGAAQIWLVVKRPATAQGTSETMRARSRFWPLSEPLPVPRRLMSQNTPAVRNPFAATTAPSAGASFGFMLRE